MPLLLGPLREALGAQKTYTFGLLASDADEKKRQETLLGPTIEEYNRVRARN